jgi:D-3-phosphoglycerate dehydrogenase
MTLGGGNIGLAVAEMFVGAFKGPVIVYDPVISASQQAKWSATIPSAEPHFAPTLDELLSQSDIVTVHCPLNEHTRDLISDRELGMMKKTSIILNTARGGVINEPALEKALREGQIYGAGLDAFVLEPPLRQAYPGLCELDNVVLTYVQSMSHG